jgi:ABC-type nitrate/sulfonate/bicarbonate transport system substrate-binding protein
MKMKRFLSVLLCAAMVAGLAGCGTSGSGSSQDSSTAATESSENNSEKTKITFVLDWTPNTNHTGLYVAEANGYFDEAGLDVEVVQPPDDGAEVLVGSGKADFGVSFQDTMAPSLVGDNALPITAVAGVIQHNTSGIVSRKGEGMDRPKGLEGKKYATWDLDVEKAMLKNVVEADGGDFSKVELIPSTVTDEVSALQSKSVDAIWIFYAWAGIATEVAGLDTDYFAFKDITPEFDYYTPVIIANNDFLAENPDTAKAFMAALSKGYEYAIENPEEAAQILMDAAPELADSEELVVESQKYLADKYQDDASQWGYIDPERWNAFYNWLNENGLTEVEIPENTGFTNDYLPEQ